MVYIIKSDSYRLLKNKINEITKDIDKDNIIYYDLSIDNIKSILEECNYTSLFNDRKAIVVYNTNIFGTKYEYKDDLKLVEDYLQSENKNTELIFLSDSISLKKKSVKIIKERGNLIELDIPEKDDLKDYIKKYISDIGIKIDNSALISLIDRCNQNIDYILNEIDKLLLVTSNVIIKEDIDKYVSDYREINIFDFVDLVIKKKVDKSLEYLNKIIDSNIEPSIIFSNIATQYRLILSVKNLVKNGYTEKDLATKFKIHPYRIKLAHENAYNYDNKELINKLLFIGELDLKIKTGEIDKYNALKIFLVNI